MHPMRKPVAGERPPREGTLAAGSLDWLMLVDGIRQNGPDSAHSFKEEYRPGVSVFLRRQLGAVGLTQLVEESLDGAVREIQSGRVNEPGDLVHFLRNILERELLIRNLNPARSLVALATATDHGRLHRESHYIQQALMGFNEAEQHALRGYYEGELSAEQAASAAGLGEGGFARLRERLYEAVRHAGMRKPPQPADSAVGAPRAMAAGSGAG